MQIAIATVILSMLQHHCRVTLCLHTSLLPSKDAFLVHDALLANPTNPDPNAPKRALSAYMFFANDNRDGIRADNPGIAFGQVGKALGEKWKTLTDAEKVPYEEKATADKKRYEDEKAAYKANAAEFDEEE